MAADQVLKRFSRQIRKEDAFKIVGFPDDHTVTGSQEEIFHHYGIDGPGLAATARQLLSRR
jgi:transketolase C-terminal domain/subunit